MARTLMVPLIRPEEDIDGASEAALPVALQLAQRLNADIVLVSVLDLPSERTPDGGQRLVHAADAFPNDPRLIPVKQQAEELVIKTGEWLESVARRYPEHRAQAVIRYGDPGRELINVVEMLDDPVVVMSSNARRGLQRTVVGSVTFKVVAQAGCPVVIVPVTLTEDTMPDLDTVLVPLDGSLLAEYALEKGLPLLGEPVDSLCLVQVIETLTPHPEAIGSDTYAMEREQARQYLTGVASRLREAGQPAEWSIRNGLPAQEIAAAAAEMDAGLIVMGTHGRSGLRRMILGSVAERVLNAAQRPLLLIRPSEADLRATAPLSSTA